MTRFEKLRQLPLLGRLLRHRFIKFGIVGASGTLVNVAVHTPILLQFSQYTIACWLGIALQFMLTHAFASYLHYLLANVLAIIIASIANFVLNDHWTFGRLRLLIRRWRHQHPQHGESLGPPRR
jgi:putative flippase GtrA